MSVSPQNWSKEALKRRVRFAYGDSLASENRNDGDVPVFGSNGVVGAHDRSITHAPAIVIGRKGSSGRTTWSDVPCFPIDTTYFVDRTQTRENMRWLFYALESLELDKINFDSAVPGLSRELAYSLPLVFPPLPEQQRIAAYLDASCGAIDAAVVAKRRQLETLDALRKSIVHRAVTNGLNPAAPRRASGVAWFGEIPQHWRCEHLKRFTKRIQAGMTPPTATPEYYFDGTIPWFAPGSFNGDIDLREPRKLINELARSEGKLRIFPTETVFLVGIGATIGKVGLVSAEASCNQQLIGIVCGHRMHSRFLAYQFKIYEDVIPGIATATTLPIFDQVKTGYLPTLQPPLEEQKSICVFLDTKLAESKQIIAGIETQIATLTAYRKSLIHECVTGQRLISKADVVRSQLSENTGQLKLQPSEKNGRLKTADGGRPAMLCRPDQSPAMNTEDLL